MRTNQNNVCLGAPPCRLVRWTPTQHAMHAAALLKYAKKRFKNNPNEAK